ncbi:hypothetical protein GCM10027347_16480 [Larkinella harenae]
MKSSKLNVLIVENNRFLVNILRQTLSSEFSVTVAANGFEAMALLERGLTVDLMLTDLKLPKFDGLELIQRIRSTISHHMMPILALSEEGDSNIRISCLENGADDCMTKPFNPLEIQAKIKAMLRRSGGRKSRITGSLKPFFPGLESLGLN